MFLDERGTEGMETVIHSIIGHWGVLYTAAAHELLCQRTRQVKV